MFVVRSEVVSHISLPHGMKKSNETAAISDERCCMAGLPVREMNLAGSDNRAPCGLRGCKNRPAPFPDRMS